jgi:hypothetical protein
LKAFFSYQTADRHVAAELRDYLRGLEVDCFMAHDDIEVSAEWQTRILEELAACDLFVAVLSANYMNSAFCLQESGIAVARTGVTFIPISLDGTVSPGFMGRYQSKRVDPKRIDMAVLLAGVAHHDPKHVLDRLVHRFAGSGSFRRAESNYIELEPFLRHATDEDYVAILKASAENDQIREAGLMANKYLPPLFAKYGDKLPEPHRTTLKTILDYYAEGRAKSR